MVRVPPPMRNTSVVKRCVRSDGIVGRTFSYRCLGLALTGSVGSVKGKKVEGLVICLGGRVRVTGAIGEVGSRLYCLAPGAGNKTFCGSFYALFLLGYLKRGVVVRFRGGNIGSERKQ